MEKNENGKIPTITNLDMEELYIETRLGRYLDEVLAKSATVTCPVATCAGAPGSGRTSIVRSWLKHHHLPNVWYDAAASSLFRTETTFAPVDLGVPGGVKIVSGEEPKALLTPYTEEVESLFRPEVIDRMDGAVVVIDDYDLGEEIRPQLLRFVKDLVVTDPRLPSHERRVSPKVIAVIVNAWAPEHLTAEERALFGL